MNRIVTALLSLYLASFLYMAVPYTKLLPVNVWIHLGAFAIAFVLIFLVLGNVVSTGGKRPLITGIIGLAFIGALVAVLYHIIGLTFVEKLPYHLDMLFASDVALTLWLAVPLVLLAF